MLLFRLLVFLIPCLLSRSAFSESVELLSSSYVIGKTIFALIGIVLLILGMSWLAKKMGINAQVTSAELKAIAQLPLGQRERAVLIESNGVKILLGVTQGGINTLHVFNGHLSEDTYPINRAKNTQSEGEASKNNYLASNNLEASHLEDSHPESNHSKEFTDDFTSFLKKAILPKRDKK